MVGVMIPLEARLHEFDRRLEAAGLQYPEAPRSPGIPNYVAVARMLGANSSNVGMREGAPAPLRVLIDEMVAKRGLMGFKDWMAASLVNPQLNVPTRVPDETLIKLEEWLDQAPKLGLKIPERVNCPGEPAFHLVAKALDLNANRLAHKFYPYREAILGHAATYGFMSAAEFAQRLGLSRQSQKKEAKDASNLEVLRDHLTKVHIALATPLPEAKHRLGSPNYKEIFQNAGLPFRGFHTDAPFVRLVDEAAQIVGVGADGFRPARDPSQFSFGEFRHRGMARFDLEMAGAAASTRKRFKGALAKWMDVLNRSDTDLLGGDFGANFVELCRQVGQTIADVDTRRHWFGNIDRWFGYYSTTTTEDASLPEDFAGALVALRRRTGNKSLANFLRGAGLGGQTPTIRNWERGTREPVQRDQTLIEKLECAYGQPKGTLTKRVRQFYRVSRNDFHNSIWPSALSTPALRRLAKPILPQNFAYLPEFERERIGCVIRDEAATSIRFRQRLQQPNKPWRLKSLPPQFKAAWDELVAYKTDMFVTLPRGSTWKPGTVDRYGNVIHEYVSFLALDPAEGGVGVPEQDISLAHIGCLDLVRRYAQWKVKRLPEGPDTGVRSWLGMFIHLVSRNASDVAGNRLEFGGYLHFVPQLVEELRPIPGILTNDDIQRWRDPACWRDQLEHCRCELAKMFKDLLSSMKMSRDPFDPILPILAMDEPYLVLMDLLRRAHAALPDRTRTSEFSRAIAVRRFVMALIAVRTALRRRNIGDLQFDAKSRKQIYRSQQGWVINIEANDFKNSRSPFFGASKIGRERSAYTYQFDEEDTAILDEYAFISRKVLMDNAGSDDCGIFLLNRHGRGISHDQMTSDMHDLTWEHSVYHETTGHGVRGVERFGLHAIRDITATHILKTTGDYNAAADSIQDSVSTVLLHYARFLSGDKTRRVQAILRSHCGSGNWGDPNRHAA